MPFGSVLLYDLLDPKTNDTSSSHCAFAHLYICHLSLELFISLSYREFTPSFRTSAQTWLLQVSSLVSSYLAGLFSTFPFVWSHASNNTYTIPCHHVDCHLSGSTKTWAVWKHGSPLCIPGCSNAQKQSMCAIFWHWINVCWIHEWITSKISSPEPKKK